MPAFKCHLLVLLTYGVFILINNIFDLHIWLIHQFIPLLASSLRCSSRSLFILHYLHHHNVGVATDADTLVEWHIQFSFNDTFISPTLASFILLIYKNFFSTWKIVPHPCYLTSYPILLYCTLLAVDLAGT